ncbi:hypothetical protein SCLCIDRAFT_596027 [Scleroderma citrinum Foug A]|uniref:Uncharacterized protein n=1 Tax=Scleroderma citrinum Foug A TaxID=1036808 RepID=A0A0C3DW60_9AGAM|nr:hypothetical protein SCLCIDRAFT_596027 [Scleroderma citrinum Foug A]
MRGMITYDLWYYIIYSHNYTETTVVTIVSITGSSQRYHILSRMQPYSCQDVDDPEFYTPNDATILKDHFRYNYTDILKRDAGPVRSGGKRSESAN